MARQHLTIQNDLIAQDVLNFIEAHKVMRGYTPTTREIGSAVNCSQSTAHRALDRLERYGYIEREGLRHIRVLWSIVRREQPKAS